MNLDKSSDAAREETPVDSVRRVRERLHNEVRGDIHELAERSRAVVEELRVRLGLKVAAPPTADRRRDGTAG